LPPLSTILAFAGVAGCRSEAPAPPAPASAGLIPYATVERTPARVPARFEAPLPRSVAEFASFGQGDPRFPPPSHVRDLVALGDAAMQGRYREAMLQAVGAGATAAQVRESYGALLEFQEGAALCGFGARLVAEPIPDAVKASAWEWLAACESAGAAELFEGAEVPPFALVKRANETSLAGRPVSWSDRLDAAVRHVIANGTLLEARVAAFTLVGTRDPRAVRTLVAVHPKVPAERGLEIAMALHDSQDERAHELFRAACATKPSDPSCTPSPAGADTQGPDLSKGLEAAALDDEVGLEELVAAAADRREEVVRALSRCVREARPARRAACLRELARLDRPLAAREAGTFTPPEEPDADLVELLASLRGFASPKALEDRMRTWALLAASPAVEPAGVTALDVLMGAGRVHAFDAETGMFPNGHDSLLRSLAALGGPGLQGVVFEELPPTEEGDEAKEPYVVNAYVDGQKVTVRARNFGDWYDVEAVLGLVNVLSRDRKSDVRFLTRATGDQMVMVVAGPEAGLRAMTEAGLLVPGPADRAMSQGKAFEERVIRKLQGSQ
jgi:hypothetical protein